VDGPVFGECGGGEGRHSKYNEVNGGGY
jgi:hypothetical protein